MASSMAASVPGHGASQWSLIDAVFDKRRIDADDLGAAHLAFDDPLGVGVEVVTGLEVGGDQEDHLGVGMVAGRPVETHPQRVSEPCPGGADVGVRVVPVDSPGVQHALDVAVVARPPDVVDDLVVATLTERRADSRARSP